MDIAEHVMCAIRQLRAGETIGLRQTPVISFWDMRSRWERYGQAWELTGTDGDTYIEGRYTVIPSTLALVYFHTHDGRICQLAYETIPEARFSGDDYMGIKERHRKYETARASRPTRI